MRGEPVNPWYDLGLERIGCYPCPATDLADIEIVEEHFPGFARWKGFLEAYARATGRDPRWVDLGLWRFRRMPRSLREIAGDSFDGDPSLAPELAIRFQVGEWTAVADNRVEVRGNFDRSLDIDRAAELLTVLGETSVDRGEGVVHVGDVVTVTADGTVTAAGGGRNAALDLLERARQLLVRAELCVGCGVCVPRCPSDALSTLDGRVHLDMGSCVHCGSCFGPCAVVDFPPHVDPLDSG
jgi:phosphoadenosine phosphosulfate reductase